VKAAASVAIALLSATASIGCWFLYFTLYWPYRRLFNAEGRYFDAGRLVVYHEQAGLLIVPAVALLLLAAVILIRNRLRVTHHAA
jgi:low affinity Fe/Cu permease